MSRPETLKEFIEQQLRDRYMSARQFADLVGVSNTTINRLISSKPNEDRTPKVDVLLKISKATNTSIIYLLNIAYPEIQKPLADAMRTSTDTLLLSQRIEQLPEHIREAIDTLIMERFHAREIKDQTESE